MTAAATAALAVHVWVVQWLASQMRQPLAEHMRGGHLFELFARDRARTS